MLNNKNLVVAGKLYYNVAYSVGSHGTGSVYSSGKVKVGTQVTITMNPNTYWVANVFATGVALSGSGNTRTFIMPRNDVSISITFNEAPKYSINCSNCSASPNPAYAGQRVTVTASVPSNVFFDNITVGGVGTSSSTSYTFTMPAKNINASTNFTYAGSQQVTVNYTVQNNSGARIVILRINDVAIDSSNGSFKLNSNKTNTLTVATPNSNLSATMDFNSSFNCKGYWYASGHSPATASATFYARPNVTTTNVTIIVNRT